MFYCLIMHTELHRHLDASFRPATLLELIKKFSIPVPFKTEDELKNKFWITKPMRTLKEVLDCFVLFQKILLSEEVLERVAFEAVEDASKEGIQFLELRYSPAFTSEYSRIPWEKALHAFIRGLQHGIKKTKIKVGLICIVSRDYGVKVAMETIDFALSHKNFFIGVDLAGNEVQYPCRIFKDVFQKAKNYGFPVTIHAGEGAGAESIWEAIDLLGATRIGHGIAALSDPVLLKRLEKDQILIETCPTSNIMTGSVKNWKSHPLPTFLEAGIPVSISTDDPGIFGVTLPDEQKRCLEWIGLKDSDMKKIDGYAHTHSFLNVTGYTGAFNLM